MALMLASVCGVFLTLKMGGSAYAQDISALSPEALQRSLVKLGDTTRLQRAMAKAQRGENVIIAFIGGSITEGAKATVKERRYVELVGDWWRKAFPKAQIEVLNAGIGATGSSFGALRVQRDVLSKNPDVLIVEFAVNDANTEANAQTYEGLIRHALNSPKSPAVLLLFMLHQDGSNAQEWFAKVGAHYDLPMISYRDAIFPEIQAGKVKWENISPDLIHPNDLGHNYTAQTVEALLAKVLATLPEGAEPGKVKPVPAPLLTDRFEHTSLFTGADLKPVVNQGWNFEAPNIKSAGWKATRPGSVLEFELPGTIIFLQCWKINGPMGKARVTIDGVVPTDIDAWFEQTWGGYNLTKVVGENLAPGKHRVRIELLQEKNPKSGGFEFRVTGIGSAGL